MWLTPYTIDLGCMELLLHQLKSASTQQETDAIERDITTILEISGFSLDHLSTQDILYSPDGAGARELLKRAFALSAGDF